MSTTKISDLPVLSTADAADEFVVVDDSAGVTKKITQAGLADFGSNTLNAAGINFGADTLDDYEEGTFTPVITAQSGTLGSQTYDMQVGQYKKIGNVVFFNLDVKLASLGSYSGRVIIDGLPFTSAEGHYPNSIAVLRDINFSAVYVTFEVSNLSTEGILLEVRDNASTLTVGYDDLQATANIKNTGFYYVS